MIATLLTLGMIGFIAFIHELGHFLVAKFSGIKVNVFSVGFGPKLLKKTIGDTEYCLSLIPLGGYVSLEGEQHSKGEGKSNEFQAKPAYIKIMVALAGVTCNVILAYLLFVCVAYLQGTGFLKSFVTGQRVFCETVRLTYEMFGQLFTGKIALKDAVGGPVLIGYVLHTIQNYSLEFILIFTALLSLVIGIFNALPIPVLDGGLVVFILLEKVFGKEKIQKIQSYLSAIFFVLFMALTLWILAYDIIRIVTKQKIF